MRKFTLLFAFLLSLIGVAQAQTQTQTPYDGIYTLGVDENQKRGYVAAGVGYPGYPVLSDISWDSYVDNSTEAVENGKNWYITSTNGGTSYYIYNVAVGKFLVGTGSQINFGDTPYLWSISTNETHTAYLNIEDMSNTGKYLSGGCGRTAADRPIAYDGNKGDGGALYTLTVVSEGDFSTQIAAADAAIAAHEEWLESTAGWTESTAPEFSTNEKTVYYNIKNLRRSKYAAYNTFGSALKQTSDNAEAGAVWYFVDASTAAAAVGTVPDGVIPVYIKNAATDLALTSATQMNYAETGTIFYLIPHTNTHTGFVISTASAISETNDSWCDQNGAGQYVCYYEGDDSGSIWAFAPASPTVVAAAAAGEAELFANELTAAKNTAIAEVEALGSRDYYAYSSDVVDECVANIEAVTATTFAEIADKKATINGYVSALKSTNPTENVLKGGDYVQLRNYAMNNCYMSPTDNQTVSAITTQDAGTIWMIVAGEGGFYLMNPLKNLYVKHPTAGGITAATLVENQADASLYNFTAESLVVKIGAVGETGTAEFLNLNSWDGSYNVVRWQAASVNENGASYWYIEKPTDDEIADLNTQLTPLVDLQAEAITKYNTQIDALNTGLEFYLYDETKVEALKTEVANKINAATTYAELVTAESEVATMISDFTNATDNRTNELTAGAQVKFQNKGVNTHYMTIDANGADVAEGITSSSIWTLVADEDDATAYYYLYNPCNHTYLVHATDPGVQAALVADKASATLFEVVPNGSYVNIRVAGTSDPAAMDYVHFAEEGFASCFNATHDRSLWAVTSATTDEQTQLTADIQAKVQEQYNATLNAANDVVAPYKNRAFYVPQTAITAYETAVTAIAMPTTYAELATAEAAVNNARAAFETAVVADNVAYEKQLVAGTKVKFNWTRDTKYHLTTNATLAETASAPNATEVRGRQSAELHAIWEVKERTGEEGFVLYNTLSGKYLSHPAQQGACATLVESSNDATVYKFKPFSDGTIKIYSSYEESEEMKYLYINAWESVVFYDEDEARSFFTPLAVTEEEWTDVSNAVETNVTTGLAAYIAEANATVQAYKDLPYFTATAEAVTAYETAIGEIPTADTYFGLKNAKAKVDAALETFLAVDRSASNLVQDGDQIRLVNKHEPTFYMTTDANGVDAYAPNEEANYVSSTIWTAIGNSTDGYKLFNPLKNGYIVHPTGNGVQATLVTDAAQATLYNIVPNGLYVNITLKEVGEEARPSLHFGTENHVTKYTADNDRSLWGISKATDAEKTQLTADIVTYVQTSITAAKEEALVKANAADDFAYYACTAENVATAVAALNAVSTDITTHEALTTELAKIEAAMKALYESERTAGPAVGDLIRFTNKVYTTHYLGYDNEGLAHYVPAETEEDGALASTTIWELEAVEGDNTKFYLKNYLVGLYAEHQYNSGWQVQFSRTQSGAHPVTITMVEHEYNERGELCFVIETTEEVNGQAIHAAGNGVAVNGSPSADASMWAVTRATDEDLDAVNLSEQLKAIVHFLLEPTIKAAKRYYYEDADGTVTNDFIDDVKAGYYTYDVEGANWDDVKSTYVSDINRCIALAEGYEGSNRDQVLGAVQHLEDWMANFKLNLPNKSGFFRVRCVYNNQYLQSDLQGSRLALNENTGTASLFYFEAGESVDGGGRLLSYDQGLYMTQGKNDAGGIYAGLQPMGTNGDAFSFSIPANNTFGSYNISSKSGSNRHVRFLYGNAYTTTQEDTVTVKHYYADNGADATVATQGDTNNNGYNWVMERVDTIPVTVSALGWATFYAPIALGIPDGIKAYICTGMDSNYDLTLVELSDVIPAGTAVLLEGAAGTHLFIDKEFEASAEVQSTENNCLRGVLAKTWRNPNRQNLNPEMTSETGYNKDLEHPAESGKVYTLGQMDGKVAMFRYAGNQFRHFCSYLDLSAEGTAGLDVLRFGEIVEPTAIEEAPVVSLEDAVIYDLSGRRVAEPGKGVYIVNGKKVYFK